VTAPSNLRLKRRQSIAGRWCDPQGVKAKLVDIVAEAFSAPRSGSLKGLSEYDGLAGKA